MGFTGLGTTYDTLVQKPTILLHAMSEVGIGYVSIDGFS